MTPIQVVALDPTVVPQHWPAAAPLIEKALPWAKARWTLESIREDLDGGFKRLWGVFHGDSMVSAVVCVNTDFPAARVCTILICGGRDMDSWLGPILGEIERAALAEGCHQVEIIGRPGWRRTCAGYDHAGEWLVKELSE